MCVYVQYRGLCSVPGHINEVRRDFRTDATLTLHFLYSPIQFGLRLAKIINVVQADVCLICANLPFGKVGGGEGV
jgi:hypothetical protein